MAGNGLKCVCVRAWPQETLCSLRFAAKVNQCETAAKGGAQRHVSTMEFGAGAGASVGGQQQPPSPAGCGWPQPKMCFPLR